MVTIENLFEYLFNFMTTFFWSINQCLKLYFNDVVLFDIPVGWWFLMFGIIGYITYRLGGN